MTLTTEVGNQSRRCRGEYVGSKAESQKEETKPWHERVQVLKRRHVNLLTFSGTRSHTFSFFFSSQFELGSVRVIFFFTVKSLRGGQVTKRKTMELSSTCLLL